ncbi:MAG: arginine 2,3-aminomutase [Bacteroidetes bacterium CG12_big_fil_rev_8_21_14_0_65_60_17]|nr:MAG: arginine 2,3-aminomutase [Bacteroidetes bacterium CG12_big_fil_rev_8_21_14_0_65_60_17]
MPSETEWNDWRWHMRHRVTTLADVERCIRVTDDEREGIRRTEGVFQWSITPYYASLMDADDPACPVRRQVVPLASELAPDIVGVEDPLEEVAHSPVKNLIHNYRDRVAFCVTSQCAIYCRYCLRKRMVGEASFMMRRGELEEALDYIRAHTEVRDVLLTGGDPLTLGERHLDWLLGSLKQIEHVDIVRIGTRMPVKLPQRITPELCEVLERNGPVWVNTHFNHAKELTPRAREAVLALLKAGVPVGNQTVLLAGINDSLDALRELLEGLVRARVRPYYLYQAQVIGGTAHFRTPIEVGMDLMARLQGRITGFAMPVYVLDTPFGKIPLNRTYVLGRCGDFVIMRSTRGRVWAEPNPRPPEAVAARLVEEAVLPEIAWPDGAETISVRSGAEVGA